jgi:hypothetical protein
MKTFIWANDEEQDIYIANAKDTEEALSMIKEKLLKIYDEKRAKCQKSRDNYIDLESFLIRQKIWLGSDDYKHLCTWAKPTSFNEEDEKKRYADNIRYLENHILDVDKDLSDELNRLYSTFPIILNEEEVIILRHYNE